MSEYVNYDGLKRYDELIKNVISVKTWMGSCSTAAGTAAKVISVESGFKLLKGVRIGVKFTNSNTASNVTLNVNSTGAKSIYYNNAVYTGTSDMICGYANRYVFYVYDGTNWVWDGYSNHDNTTYSSKAAVANGTDVSLVTTGEKAAWNAKTSNTGTITGIKMNGVSKGTSGVVDLGTVITAHQDISGKVDKTTTVNGHALNDNVSVTKSDVGLGNVTNDSQVKRSEMGVASGVATLDSAGKVPSSQLPSYVDDVLEYDTKSAFPATGEGGKIYVDKSNNTSWRWSGSAYTQIKGDLTIGTTSGTAADGKVVNDHINNTSNPHGVTKAQVGLGSVVNTGDSATPVSGGTTKFTTGGAYTELAKKVDKVSGKGLSTNDYTTAEKNKLAGIAASAEVNQNAFSNVGVKVGNTTTTVAADSKTDTVTLIQGSNITLTADTTNDTVTIAATDTNTWRPISDSVSSTSSDTSASSKAVKTAYDLAASKTSNTGTVTSVVGGTGLNGGTISTSGTLSVKYGTTAGTACQGNDSRLSDARQASDVYAWAKESTKPTYVVGEVMNIRGEGLVGNTSSTCSITGYDNVGKAETIIYTNTTSSDFIVTVPTTYYTPDGAAIELTCKAGGYCEVSYLNSGGIIYARGL